MEEDGDFQRLLNAALHATRNWNVTNLATLMTGTMCALLFSSLLQDIMTRIYILIIFRFK